MAICKLCNANKNGPWIKKYAFWNLGICPNQHTLGTLVVCLKKHKEVFMDLTGDEVTELWHILRVGQKVLGKEFKPDWYNIQQNGNWEHHLHFILFPRYNSERIFMGQTFRDETFGEPVQYTRHEVDIGFMQKLGDVFLKHMARE